MNVHALIVLVAPVLAWNPIPNHVLGRRAVVFGAASQAALVVPLVSKADDAQADLLERGTTGMLKQDEILRDEALVDASAIKDCKQLEDLLATEEREINELLPATRSYVKFQEMTVDDMDGAARRELQKMLAEADVDETRITKQLERLREEKVRRQCSP